MLLLLISLVWPLFAFHEAKVVPAQPSLYNASDPIVLLTTIDFQHTILATSNAWLVEFYSSWCGHCIDFAPAFRELANDVKGLLHSLSTLLKEKIFFILSLYLTLHHKVTYVLSHKGLL